MVYTDGVHLVADNLNELHLFAEKIKLGRHFYHGVRKGHPHYDLTNHEKKSAAVKAGAKVVNSRMVLMISKGLLNPQIDIEGVVREVLNKFPDYVAGYKAGKSGLLGMFVGEAMKLSKGKAEPKELNRTVKEMLG